VRRRTAARSQHLLSTAPDDNGRRRGDRLPRVRVVRPRGDAADEAPFCILGAIGSESAKRADRMPPTIAIAAAITLTVLAELQANRRRILLALYVFCHTLGLRSLMRDTLGEFEQMVLLAILHLGEDVYGVPIVDEIARRTGRDVAPAAVYVTLRRLEEKGLVTSWMGEPTGERGGKGRRYVSVTRAGLESLRASRKALDRMWRGLDVDLRDIR
jgi:PadR family transcriptional regulator, regulatory protein PadR